MPPQALALPAVAPESGATAAGPAMTALNTMVVSMAAILRGLAVTYAAVQVLIWQSFYLARPWALWGPAVALAWGCGAIGYLRRRLPPWPLTALDTGVYVALAVGAAWCVPIAVRGEAGNWLFVVVASQIIVPTWFAPRVLALSLALAAGGAFWIGDALTPDSQHVTWGGRTETVVLLFALVGVQWCGRWMLQRHTALADSALATADLEARDQYVVLSRNIERREHDRLLHDTVLNTLTAIARSGASGAVARACLHSIGLVERALSEPGDPPADHAAEDPAAVIGQVVGEMRARGLVVHLEVTGEAGEDAGAGEDGGAGEAGDLRGAGGLGRAGDLRGAGGLGRAGDLRGAGGRPAAGGCVAVPAAVAGAMAHATREALVNVAEHAGTGEAWVTVGATSPGEVGVPGAPGGLRVTIRDAGTGFDAGHVGLVRLGVRRSICERVTDSGGSASVRSAPGAGTLVRLSWPAVPPCATPPALRAGGAVPGEDGHGLAGAEHDPGGTGSLPWRWGAWPRRGGAAVAPAAPMTAREGAVADATDSAVPRFVGGFAVILPAGLLIQTLVHHTEYRHPLIPVMVWLGVLAAAAWLVPRACTSGLGTADAVVAAAIGVVAVTATSLDRVQSAAGTVDWTILGTVWLFALIALSTSATVWVTGSVLVLGVHAVFVMRELGASPLGLTRQAASAYAMAVVLAIFAALRPTLRTHAEMAVRRADLASRSAAERAAAAAIRQDRRDRLRLLEMEALPLLRGIAGATLDPADRTVRGQCAQHAAVLRRTLAGRPRQAEGLLARLEPGLEAARARGVPAEVQVLGDPGRPAEDVARATVAAVDGVLRTLPPQPVILSVLGSADEAEVYLTFGRAPRKGYDVAGLGKTVPAEAAWRATVEVEHSGRGCLEIHWRTAVRA